MIIRWLFGRLFWWIFLLVMMGSLLRSCANHDSIVATKESAMPVVVGYFNGIMTTRNEAFDNLSFLASSVKLSNRDQKLFYNYTDGLATDLLEVFEQRMAEQPEVIKHRFELFFEIAGSRGPLFDNLTRVYPSLNGFVNSMMQPFKALIYAHVINLASGNGKAISTTQVYREHRDDASAILKAGNRLVLVAHSQGNLFANVLLNSFSAKTKRAIRIVHIAPASQILKGGHSLADKDVVIAGIAGTGRVASVTISIPEANRRPPGANGRVDPYGHGFVEIYLNKEMDAFAQVKELVNIAIAP